MILGGGLITQALAGGGTSGGKVKPITITENGTYNVSDAEKAEGYVGFAPVTVDVKTTAVIQPLSVSEPGVYNASDYGCDGFDPVNVSDKYKKLYEQALGLGENIDTGITDPDGNEIVLDNAIETDWDIIKCITLTEGSATVTCPGTGVQLKLFVSYGETFTSSTDGKQYIDKWLSATLSNLKTGQSETYDNILRGHYSIPISEKISCRFTVEDYRITFGGTYLQFFPGRVWKGNSLWGGNDNYWNAFYPEFNSGIIGVTAGFTSPVYFQASYS